MEKDSSIDGTVPTTVDPPVTIPIANDALVTVPPIAIANVASISKAEKEVKKARLDNENSVPSF